MAIIIGPIGRALVKTGTTVVKILNRAGGNFAAVRGADLIADLPAILRLPLQLFAVPSTLASRLPLPVAFASDVLSYAAVPDIITGGGPVLDYYWSLLQDAARLQYLIALEDQVTYLHLLEQLLDQRIFDNGDGTLTVVVPPMWWRDP